MNELAEMARTLPRLLGRDLTPAPEPVATS